MTDDIGNIAHIRQICFNVGSHLHNSSSQLISGKLKHQLYAKIMKTLKIKSENDIE